MFKVKAVVIESENQFCPVFIDTGDNPILYRAHVGINAEAALREVLDYVYGDCDFDYVCLRECDGWHIYNVKVIDDLVL
jgi:hypothetical protein